MINKKDMDDAKETPEEECFDCSDWKRIGTVCPAHAQLRKDKLQQEAGDRNLNPVTLTDNKSQLDVYELDGTVVQRESEEVE